MPTPLHTEQARAAAARRDHERNLERVEAKILARMEELAAQHGLDVEKDQAALVRLGAKDEVLRELAIERNLIEVFMALIVERGDVPVIDDDGEVV
jgi:hypothetical protein